MKTRNSGFTLAEVLVSIVIGVISIAEAFASYNYFNKSLDDLKISEIAFLAGLPKGPNNYHPLYDRE